jgi:hypothetical protein
MAPAHRKRQWQSFLRVGDIGIAIIVLLVGAGLGWILGAFVARWQAAERIAKAGRSVYDWPSAGEPRGSKP